MEGQVTGTAHRGSCPKPGSKFCIRTFSGARGRQRHRILKGVCAHDSEFDVPQPPPSPTGLFWAPGARTAVSCRAGALLSTWLLAGRRRGLQRWPGPRCSSCGALYLPAQLPPALVTRPGPSSPQLRKIEAHWDDMTRPGPPQAPPGPELLAPGPPWGGPCSPGQ